MGAVLHIIRKEFIQVLKDRPMMGVIFVMPIIQLFILGNAITTDIENIHLAVVDYDRSDASRFLISRFEQSGRFILTPVRDRPGIVQETMDESVAMILIRIPRGFGAELLSGGSPAIQIVVDGVDSNSALIAGGYARSIISDHFAGSRHTGQTYETVRPIAFYNPTMESKFTIVPGVTAALLTVITMLLTALGLVREKEKGTLEQLNVTPVRPIQLMIGKSVPFVILGGLTFVAAMAVTVHEFRIPMRGNYLTLALFTGIYLLTMLGFGLLVSTISSTQQQALFVSWFVLVVSFLMSGFMFPISNMPAIMQKFTYAIPMRYYITVMREVLLKGAGIARLAFQLKVLSGMMLGVFLLSVLKFRKRI